MFHVAILIIPVFSMIVSYFSHCSSNYYRSSFLHFWFIEQFLKNWVGC